MSRFTPSVIQVLYRDDGLGLHGIPYHMRYEQHPRNVPHDLRGDWQFLGMPGWFSGVHKDDIPAIKIFIQETRRAGALPTWHDEWLCLNDWGINL